MYIYTSTYIRIYPGAGERSELHKVGNNDSNNTSNNSNDNDNDNNSNSNNTSNTSNTHNNGLRIIFDSVFS